MDEKKKQNIDILGKQWRLAPGGRDAIDRCQRRIMEIQYETQGLAALFRNMRSCKLNDEELYGVGIALERISRRLSKTFKKLSGVATSESEF